MKGPAPRMSGRLWLALWVALVLIGLGSGIAARLSHTDYNADPQKLASLPYLYAAATSQAVALTPETAKSSGMVDMDQLVEDSPLVVSATFDGARSYAYQSFVSELRVTRVYRGDGLEAGQVISVFESEGIRPRGELDSWEQQNPAAYASFAEHFDASGAAQAPSIVRPAEGIGLHGCPPMRPGQDYLLFLSPKAYPPVEDRAGLPQEYTIENNPYARIALPLERLDESVGILDARKDFLSFQEAQDYSFIVGDPADKALYEQTAAALVARVEQMGR